MNTAQNGKGDAPRPVNLTRYGENYDAIFRKVGASLQDCPSCGNTWPCPCTVQAKEEAEARRSAADCSREHGSQNPCQRAHNYMTYGLGIIAHRLEQGCDRKMVADFAIEIRDRAEEIRSENAKGMATGISGVRLRIRKPG